MRAAVERHGLAVAVTDEIITLQSIHYIVALAGTQRDLR
jgi:hypothetical protein